jgi:hypothetical protein
MFVADVNYNFQERIDWSRAEEDCLLVVSEVPSIGIAHGDVVQRTDTDSPSIPSPSPSPLTPPSLSPWHCLRTRLTTNTVCVHLSGSIAFQLLRARTQSVFSG